MLCNLKASILKSIRYDKNGFTLIELSIVIIIIGILLIPMIVAYERYLTQKRIDITKENVKLIEEAITKYVNDNGDLPCVANAVIPADDPAHGAPVDCVSPPSVPGVVTVAGARDGTNVIIGAVPFRAINIPMEQASDGWGRRLTYAVTQRLANGTIVPFDASRGEIAIVDQSNTSLITPAGSAMYVVISHGKKGEGGLNLMSGSQTLACDATQLDGENCDGDATFRGRTATIHSEAGGAQSFDDYASYPMTIEIENKPETILPGWPDVIRCSCYTGGYDCTFYLSGTYPDGTTNPATGNPNKDQYYHLMGTAHGDMPWFYFDGITKTIQHVHNGVSGGAQIGAAGDCIVGRSLQDLSTSGKTFSAGTSAWSP